MAAQKGHISHPNLLSHSCCFQAAPAGPWSGPPAPEAYSLSLLGLPWSHPTLPAQINYQIGKKEVAGQYHTGTIKIIFQGTVGFGGTFISPHKVSAISCILT